MTDARSRRRSASGDGAANAVTAQAREARDEITTLAHLHARAGWLLLLIFLALGAVLESLHGFKVRFYLDAANETRRLMWTLCHAHGSLLALVNVAFAATLCHLPAWDPRARRLASRCLLAATVLLPSGFMLGGAVLYAGDPGLGIALVPIGAALLFIGVFLAYRGCAAWQEPNAPAPPDRRKPR